MSTSVETHVDRQTFLTTPPLVRSKYRPEIDGLRAFAVLAVIINHFNKDLLPSGYLGVDIFFVISGYVITSSLANRESTDFRDFITGFYVRRIKRLLPALVVFVLITSILICLFNPSPKLALNSGIASLFGLSNISLYKQSTDYFAQSTELNPFTHTWSLGVEEQFYLLFPFLIWFSGFGRQAKNGARNLFLLIGAFAVASLAGFIYLYQTDQPAAYFLIPARFWEMAAGCLVFIGFQKRAKIEQALEQVPPLLVIATMVGVMYLPISSAVPATISIVALSVILIACLKCGTAAFNAFTNKRVVYVGLISYSLYLWHWGVLSISRWTIGIHLWSVLIQAALMLILAMLSYRFIERVSRRAAWSSKRYLNIFIGVILSFTSSLFIMGLKLDSVRAVTYLGSKKGAAKIHNTSWRNQISLGGSKLNGATCHADEGYSSIQIDRLFLECISPHNKKLSQKTVAFVGDSHALALLSSEGIITRKGGRVMHFSFSGCPFPRPGFGVFPLGCDKFLKRSEAELLTKLKKGDVIVVFNYHLSHLGDRLMEDVRHHIRDSYGNLPTDQMTKINLYIDGLSRLAIQAKERGIGVLLVGAGCRNNYLQIQQREWFRPFADNRMIAAEVLNAKRLNQKLREGLRGTPNIKFIESKTLLKRCTDIDNYFDLYRDTDHLSDNGAVVLMGDLLRAL